MTAPTTVLQDSVHFYFGKYPTEAAVRTCSSE